MTATEPLTNLSGGVESRHATQTRNALGDSSSGSVCSDKSLSSGSSAPPAQKLCADCDCEIDPGEELCVICWFAHNDEHPDGRWVNTNHAGWIYE